MPCSKARSAIAKIATISINPGQIRGSTRGLHTVRRSALLPLTPCILAPCVLQVNSMPICSSPPYQSRYRRRFLPHLHQSSRHPKLDMVSRPSPAPIPLEHIRSGYRRAGSTRLPTAYLNPPPHHLDTDADTLPDPSGAAAVSAYRAPAPYPPSLDTRSTARTPPVQPPLPHATSSVRCVYG